MGGQPYAIYHMYLYHSVLQIITFNLETLQDAQKQKKNSPLFDSGSVQSAFVNWVSLHSAQTTSDPDGIGHWDLRRIRADDRTETTRDANHDGSSEAPRPRNKCWLINHLMGRHGEKSGCPELPSGAAWRVQLQLRLVITHLPGSPPQADHRP